MLNHPKKYFVAVAWIAIALLGVRSQTQSSRSILIRPAPPADHRIAYGKDEFQFGELRLPKGPSAGKPPYPVAVIIHGGCWLSQYGLSYMGHLSADLAEAGVATWNIEYRRIGNPGGGWPGTFEDVARATDTLRTLANTYPFDLDRVIAVGHSAGGHLALLLGARKPLPKGPAGALSDPVRLRGVVALAGITDLRRTGTACDGEVLQLMSGPAKDNAAAYTRASPIELVPLGVPQIIVQGDADTIIPAAMAKDYADAARKKGDETRLVMIEKAGHFELVDPKSFAWEKVKSEILAWLKANEAGNGK